MALRWGIVSTGGISHDFVNALSTLPKEDHQVICVGARNLKSAQDFAERFQIPTAYEGYELIAKNSNVEAVYIGALHPAHITVATLMLQNGKHVLCEKPLCMNRKEVEQLVKLAKEKQLFLMEAIWSRFFPSYQYLKQQIDSDALGQIKEVQATFGYDHKGSDRTTKKALGGGVTLDQGVYVIQASQWAFRERPQSIKAHGVLSQAEQVDVRVVTDLTYSNGGFSTLTTDATKFLNNQYTVKGTKGQITLEPIWCPTSLIDIDGTKKEWPLPEAKYKFNYPNSCGLRYEAEAARKCIRSGLLECETVTHKESLLIASIQDEIRKQLGVIYQADL